MTGASFVKRFAITGLHYYRNFELTFTDSIVILVGENGLGKTTVLNILDAVLKGRWQLLGSIGFDIVEIEFRDGRKIRFTHSELDCYLILSNYDRKNERNSDILRKFTQLESEYGDLVDKFVRIEQLSDEILRENPILYLPAVRNLREDLRVVGLDLERVQAYFKRSFFSEFSRMKKDWFIPTDLDYLTSILDKPYDDNSIRLFVQTCNEYLVNTSIAWDIQKKKFGIVNKLTGERIISQQLSSGEQQIIYIFFHIYLSGHERLGILFDEPELSLSLSWQRKILTDIVSSERCSFLFAITHSPFTFDNDLVSYAKGINVCFKTGAWE